MVLDLYWTGSCGFPQEDRTVLHPAKTVAMFLLKLLRVNEQSLSLSGLNDRIPQLEIRTLQLIVQGDLEKLL